MAMTVAEGSKAAKCGVARFRRPCGEGEERFHRRTVLSREHERNVSEDGFKASAVTGAMWPLK